MAHKADGLPRFLQDQDKAMVDGRNPPIPRRATVKF